MAGIISWKNRVFDASGVTVTDYSHDYAGSDSGNVADRHLALDYKYDGSSGNLVRIQWSADITVRCVGICGVTTESGDAPDVTFTLTGKDGGVAQFTEAGLSLDATGATIIAVLDADETIDELVLSADGASAETYIGLGALWAGDGLTLGNGEDAWLLSEWQPQPARLDVKRRSVGGQVYGRSLPYRRRWRLPLGFAVGVAKVGRAGNTMAALEREAGTTGPIAASLRGDGNSQLCLYGSVEELTPITRGPGDRFGKVLVIEEDG